MVAVADGAILVVDDDETTRAILAGVLSAQQYDVRTSGTIESAKTEIVAEVPDLVLLANQLPDGHGQVLCRYLRTSPKTANLPVILMTTQTDTGNRWLATEADALIHKPVRDEELLMWVRPLVLARQTRVTMDRVETMLVSIAASAEARSDHRAGHLWRVAWHSQQLARTLGLDERRVTAIRKAALLHDIGMIRVSEATLRQPRALTQAEFEQVKAHAALGAELCRALPDAQDISTIVRSHHERWEGGGYPDSIAGEQIPLGARILAAVDAFDTMTTERPYRAALSIDDAIDALWLGAGAHWDPNIVAKLVVLVQRERVNGAADGSTSSVPDEPEGSPDRRNQDPLTAFIRYLALTGDRP